jgi:ATP-binding cassette subfamily C (CFTR/MRP) protein 1
MGRAQAIWIKAIETRVTSTSSWISNAKVVKMLGFSDILEYSLQKLRQDEVNLSRKFRKIFTIRVLLSRSPPYQHISWLLMNTTAFFQSMLAPILTFGILIATGHTVNSSNIFSIISILTLLADPISIIIQFMPDIATALKCFERIQEFLNSEMQKDHRLDLNTLEASQNISSLDKEDLIVVQDASIGWPAMESPILHNLNFTVKRSQMVFIIGPVGMCLDQNCLDLR